MAGSRILIATMSDGNRAKKPQCALLAQGVDAPLQTPSAHFSSMDRAFEFGAEKRARLSVADQGLVVFFFSSVLVTVPSGCSVTVVSFDLTVPSLFTVVFSS